MVEVCSDLQRHTSMGLPLLEGTVMSAALPVTVIEPSEIAVAGFLARYREPTLSLDPWTCWVGDLEVF